MDSVELAGAAVVVALIAAQIIHQRWASNASRRESDGHCVRCGQSHVDRGRGPQPRTMCLPCRQKTQNVYRLVLWLFGGLALIFAAGAPFIVITEARRFGAAATFEALVMLAGVIFLVGGFAWVIRPAATGIQ